MASALPKELEDTWSERHVGNVENNDGKDYDEIAFNHKILNGSQGKVKCTFIFSCE